MKAAFAIGAIVAIFALPSVTQDITSLPQCAQQPILEAISASGCPLTDIACICANEDFVNGLVELIPTVCTADEVELVIDFAETLCSAYDVDIDLPTLSAPSGTALTPPTASQPTSAPESVGTSNPITATPTTSAPATLTSSDTPPTTISITPGSSTASSTLSETPENAASTISTSSIATGATETSTSASESSTPAQQTDNVAAANAIVSPVLLGAMAIAIFAVI